MTDFFIYRQCDVTGTEARRIIQRNADILNRGIALIQGDSGVPADDSNGSDNPVLPIVSASWTDPVDGAGKLPPGTYDYKIIPINTCTGRTGQATQLPPLTVSTLGKVSTLRLKLGSKPRDCNGALIQRNGKVVGATFPTSDNVLDNVPLITSPKLTGDFQNGTTTTFDIDYGSDPQSADLQFGDLVFYQNFSVKVVGVSGNTVTFEPPIPAAPPTPPPGFFDLGARTGIYFNDIVSMPFPSLFFYGMPFPTPWMGFKTIPIPGLLAIPQIGDLILYGSKTAIIVGVQPSASPIGALEVAVIPFGLLPLPPLPAGLYQLIARPLAAFTPSVGLYFNLDSQNYGGGVTPPTNSAYEKFEVLGDPLNSGAPVDPNIVPGNYLGINGQFVQIKPGGVENGTNISGGADLFKARVTVTPSWNTDVQVRFPFPIPATPANQVGIIGGYGVPTGPYVALPASLAGMFLTTPGITPMGGYTRLTRIVGVTTDNDIFQWQEDGAYQDRAGTVDGTDAKTALNQVFVQNNYPGGLPGLMDKVRGPRATTPAKVFVKTNGALVQIGQKLKAVNVLAKKGNGTIISLTKLRLFRDQLCGSWANVTAMNTMLQEQGFAAARFEAREVILDPAACPPGQTDVRETQLFCVGLATPQTKVKDGEQVRFFWAEGRRTIPGTKKKLIAVGLTSDEADSAAQLQTSGRLLSVIEIATSETSDLVDFGELGPDKDLDAVLDDTRIGSINTGNITRTQIGDILKGRGSKGIIKRPPGTDPSTVTQPGFLPIDDFALPVHNLAGLALTLQASFDVCDFDAALASLPDGPLKTSLAAFFAAIEAALNGLVQAGQAILNFIENGPFTDAVDTIAALIAAIIADPTLACLIGPTGSVPFPGLAGIKNVDQFLQGFAFAFQVRFDLSSLLGEAIAAILCSLIGALVTAIGNFGGAAAAAFAQRAIGCIPALDLGLQFPSLDVQIAIECSLDQLNTLLDIIQALIAEANEVIDFLNNIGAGGFVMRAIEAQNNACSSGTDLQSLVGGLTALAG